MGVVGKAVEGVKHLEGVEQVEGGKQLGGAEQVEGGKEVVGEEVETEGVVKEGARVAAVEMGVVEVVAHRRLAGAASSQIESAHTHTFHSSCADNEPNALERIRFNSVSTHGSAGTGVIITPQGKCTRSFSIMVLNCDVVFTLCKKDGAVPQITAV